MCTSILTSSRLVIQMLKEATSTEESVKLSNLYSQNCTQKNFTHAPFGTFALVSIEITWLPVDM